MASLSTRSLTRRRRGPRSRCRRSTPASRPSCKAWVLAFSVELSPLCVSTRLVPLRASTRNCTRGRAVQAVVGMHRRCGKDGDDCGKSASIGSGMRRRARLKGCLQWRSWCSYLEAPGFVLDQGGEGFSVCITLLYIIHFHTLYFLTKTTKPLSFSRIWVRTIVELGSGSEHTT